jgi:hypothetical protein
VPMDADVGGYAKRSTPLVALQHIVVLTPQS